MATCSKCGKLNYEGVKFCTACGTPLASSGGYNYREDDDSEEQPNSNETTQSKPQPQTTKVNKGFDKRILYIVLGVVLLVGIVFLIRYLTSSQDLQVEFTYTEGILTEGDIVVFKSLTQCETCEWDFGDSTDKEYGNEVSHIYLQASTYKVTLLVNGKFVGTKDIQIAPVVFDQEPIDSRPLEATIDGPTQVTVGEVCVFEDFTPGDSSREWSFADKEGVFSREKKVSYTFKKPFAGGYKITLNSKGAQNQKTISVVVLPQKREQLTDNSGKKQSLKPALTEEAVKVLFQDILDEKKKLREVMNALKAITGDDNTIKVSETGTSTKDSQLVGFVNSLVMRSDGQTKWKVESVKYDFNTETGYVKSLRVNLKELK